LSRALKVKLSRTKLPRTLRRRDTENAERHGARGEKNYEESTEKAQSTRRKMWGEGWMIRETVIGIGMIVWEKVLNFQS
jgi:hypothetical protein